MSGCHEARNAVTIAEAACPECGAIMEVFAKDGSLCMDAVCEECGYCVERSTPLEELQCD